MQLLLLGSAAAEGWPAPFCECDACERARRLGGINVRTRSGALIDDDLKIDFSPDTLVQLQRQRRSIRSVRTIVFTHEHSDHVAAAELEWMVKPFTTTPPAQRVQVFGNQAVLEEIRAKSHKGVANVLELNPLRPHEPATTRDGDVILPLPATHSPGALVLRITRTRDSKSIFYGHDSGVFPSETIDALNRAGPVDIAVFDCTNGGQPSQQPGPHMGVSEVVQMVELFKRGGAIVDRTRCVATHFSHNGKLSHEQLVRALMPHGIEAAFDGMRIDV